MDKRRTIEQAASETGLTADTLRYYERVGLISGIERAASGHRRYTGDDIVWIMFLKQLRATGMSIAQMQHFAHLRRQGDATVSERRQMLEQHRQQLQEQIEQMLAFMDVIDLKIARHKQREQAMIGEPEHERNPLA